jgi:hypothetical protein
MQPEPTAFIDLVALRQYAGRHESLFDKLLTLFLEQAPYWIQGNRSAAPHLRCHRPAHVQKAHFADLFLAATARLNGYRSEIEPCFFTPGERLRFRSWARPLLPKISAVFVNFATKIMVARQPSRLLRPLSAT